MKKLSVEQKETIGALVVLVGGGVALLAYMAGKSLSFPDVDVKNTAQAILGGFFGLSLMALGGIMVYFGIKQGGRALFIIPGAFLFILAMPLVGVTVGLPSFMEPLVGLANAVIGLLNLVIDLLGNLA